MITKEMTVSEVLSMDEKYEKIFEKYFLTCAGCSGAEMRRSCRRQRAMA